MIKHKTKVFKNGLRLVIGEKQGAGTVTVIVGIRAGSRCETRETKGLFHFLEHMAFKGTKSRRSTKEIAKEIDGAGGEFSAYTSKELTVFKVKIASNKAYLAVGILADILSNSLLLPEEIEKEKGVIIEEINMQSDLPTRRVLENFEFLLFGDNPMGWETAGSKESVVKICRDDLQKGIEKFYVTRNMIVATVGNIIESKILQAVESNFTGFRQGESISWERVEPDKDVSRVKLEFRETEQAHFCLGVPGFALTDSERYPETVLASILGGTMSSMLHLLLVDRLGLAYYTGVYPVFFSDEGYFVVQAGVKLSRLEKTIRVTRGLLESLCEKGVDTEDLERAKGFLCGHFLIEQEEAEHVASEWTKQGLLEGGVRDPITIVNQIKEVSGEEVKQIARRLFMDGDYRLSIICPKRDVNVFEKMVRNKQ